MEGRDPVGQDDRSTTVSSKVHGEGTSTHLPSRSFDGWLLERRSEGAVHQKIESSLLSVESTLGSTVAVRGKNFKRSLSP